MHRGPCIYPKLSRMKRSFSTLFTGVTSSSQNPLPFPLLPREVQRLPPPAGTEQHAGAHASGHRGAHRWRRRGGGAPREHSGPVGLSCSA